MDPPRFVIEASEAESMAKNSGTTVLQLLPSLVKSAQTLARTPISKFHVGSVGLASDGRIFLGVNVEFPGLPLHHSIHSEQFLLTNLAVHAAPRLLAFAVSAAPCGHCRQFIQELRDASDIQILITNEPGSANFRPVSSILPNPFGPFDLLDKETPLLLENHNNNLSFFPTTKNIPEIFSKIESEIKIIALEAANNSHAPYSGCPSGVALMDSHGKIHKGSYNESAAYNPSLGPVQAALVAYIASGGGGYDGIMAAVLVEMEGVVVRQEDTARMLLKVISPKCEFRVVHCGSDSIGSKKSST